METQFAFAGVPDPNQSQDLADAGLRRPKILRSRRSLKGVSAKQEKIPDLPIVTVAQNEVALDVLPANAPAAAAEDRS